MVHWSNGLFGFTGHLQPLLDALAPLSTPLPTIDMPQTPLAWDGKLDIPTLQASYRAGVSPLDVIETIYSKIKAYEKVNPGSWIHLLPKEKVLAAARGLIHQFPDRSKRPPLFGVPFSLKDSIDVAGFPTTTACPPLSHTPSSDAPVYTSLISQGGLFVGKANMDQLATGLTGQRSPYGACASAVNGDYICGGSSSGSAVQVGARLVSFSLGTDTAGSGRVPAAFNGVVGWKPTRGTVPLVGITPACQSLDCIAVLASTVSDARAVWRTLETFSPLDPYAKPPDFRKSARPVHSLGPPATQFRFGVPPAAALATCSPPYRRLFERVIAQLQEMGGKLQPIDWEPFEKAGKLLYEGSFVHERLAAIPDLPSSGGLEAREWLEKHKGDVHPVISELFTSVLNRGTTATEVFRDLQAQRRYTSQVHDEAFTRAAGGVDVVVTPTAPTHWSIEEVRSDPISKNSALGVFAHCANVLDLCAVSCPAGRFDASEFGGERELPFGVMFMGGSGADCEVLEIARRFEEAVRDGEGAKG